MSLSLRRTHSRVLQWLAGVLLWADGQPELGPDHLGFELDSMGEALGLYAPDGTAIDAFSFPQQASDLSAGRVPDGSSSWAILEPATPGASNGK